MKIALLTHTFFPEFVAGREKHVKMLAEHLSRKDNVFVITGSNKPRTENGKYSVVYLPVLSFPVSHSPKQFYRFVFGVYSELKKINPDIVHTHELEHSVSLSALFYCLIHRKKLVITCHGFYDETPFIKIGLWFFRNTFGKVMKKKAHKIIFVSEIQKKAYGFSGKKYIVIPNGVLLKKMTHPKKVKDRYLISAGRLMSNKNFKTLIKAFYLISKEFTDLKLIILGDDFGELNNLKKLISDLELTEKVFLPGVKLGKEYETLIMNAKAFVNCSFNEGMPLSVLEALSLKVPIVCPHFDSLERVFGKKYIFYINSHSSESIASKLKILLNKEDTNFINPAYENLKSLDWSVISDKIRSCYK